MTAPQSALPPPVPAPPLDPCLFGYGIACGLAVHLTDECTVVVGAGTLVTRAGTVLHLPEKRFRYYRLPAPNAPAADGYELADGPFDAATMDSLKNQFRGDTPERYFLDDKIVVLDLDERLQPPPRPAYWLRGRHELVREDGLADAARRLAQPAHPSRRWGIFARHKPVPQFEVGPIEQVLRPVLQLPDVVLPRFGYQALAYLDPARRNDFDDPATTTARLDNLRNPFAVITGYAAVFTEYKAILDDAVPALADALAVLHELFGPLLTHKGPETLKKFRRVLLHKWQVFLEQGAHLFYVQCYYDWLSDLGKAYDELRRALGEFDAGCGCPDAAPPPDAVSHVRLGPVLGGLTTYKPLIFRDYFRVPFTTDHNERRLLEIRCLHWRMMTMIWTFDLPFLRLEQYVLIDEGYQVPAEEFQDSSDYWERDFAPPGRAATFADLPIRATPGRPALGALGGQAIPYYFPLDADSPYSVHRYWDFAATHENRTDRHHSYNANRGTDSYTARPEARFPLLYELREYPLLRVEGHLGRAFDAALAEAREVVQKYNLGLEVVAVNVDADAPVAPETDSVINLTTLLEKTPAADYRYNLGLEHQGGLCAGHTWVLLFTAKGANIDLSECKKREGTLEIAPNTVVADFVLPYRFSCCHRTVQP